MTHTELIRACERYIPERFGSDRYWSLKAEIVHWCENRDEVSFRLFIHDPPDNFVLTGPTADSIWAQLKPQPVGAHHDLDLEGICDSTQ